MGKKRVDNNKQMGAPSRNGALFVLGTFLLLGILIAGARFVHLQVIEAERLSGLAEQQRLRRIETPAQRGTIFDSAGRVLAQSVRVYTVVVDPHNISEFYDDYVAARNSREEPIRLSLEDLHEELAQYFAEKLEVSVCDLLPQFSRRAASGNWSRYSILARQVSPELRLQVNSDTEITCADTITPEERLFKQALSHTVWELDYKRIYPLGEVAAQVVGFVNAEGYGAAGIELQYEELLRGTPGVSFTERDVAGNIIPAGIQRNIEVQRGSDIMLTIDANITQFVQEELEAAVRYSMAQSASAIVMDPRTGAILAATSYPSFDPNEFNRAEPEAIRNRALTDVVEPGSTIKPLTIAAALDAGAVVLNDTFYVPSSIQVGTRVVSDVVPRPSEQMSVTRIMEISSNVGTTRIAQQMEGRAFYDYLHKFGITERPGLDFPGAGRGQVLPPEQWSDVSLSNFSFGQGLSMTPLQLSRAIAAIANDGVMTTPHFLQAVPDGSYEMPYHEELRAISSEAAGQTLETMRVVMNGESGTGRHLDVQDFDVAGKSGTAQKAREGIAGYVEGLYVSSFMGFMPADDPQLLVTVFVDEPRNGFLGSRVAGPPFANIATFAARYLGLPAASP